MSCFTKLSLGTAAVRLNRVCIQAGVSGQSGQSGQISKWSKWSLTGNSIPAEMVLRLAGAHPNRVCIEPGMKRIGVTCRVDFALQHPGFRDSSNKLHRAGNSIPAEMLLRLAEAHPNRIRGIKDSSGDMVYTLQVASRLIRPTVRPVGSYVLP
jgi:hypothetical protein